MAFCAKCGASLAQGAVFCGSCGTPVGAAAPAGPGVPAATPPPAASAAPLAGMTSNTAALLAYIPFVGWIIAIVFLVVEPYKNDRFVRFHAFQSIFFAIFCFVLSWAMTAFAVTAWWGSGFSMIWMFTSVFWLIRLAILGAWLFLMYKAYNNERFELPVIGPLAAKQAGV
ncbi:MAG TPA: zinc-ribbon domain-containing protein [Terriglobia bacterium]|nr:zinc-ribbon domain-containing protein [Terriglobia bacterium]